MNFDFTSRLQKIDTILEKELPQEYDSQWTESTFSSTLYPVPHELIKTLVQPCRNLLLLGGKRWRPLLMVLCGELAIENSIDKDKNTQEKILKRIYSLTPLVEFVHTASLIHDDIEDNADMRRGKPSAHITYGIDSALNAGSWLYFQATQCMLNKSIYWGDNKDSLKLCLFEQLNIELRRLHLGQAMDIAWHKNNTSLASIEEYLTMTSLKTGTLASLSAIIGLLAGGESVETAKKVSIWVSNIGVGFQILDDVINLTTGNVGKKRGDDIVEGKKSLPVLYHLQNNKDDFTKLMDCFSQAREEGIDSPAVENAISIIQSSDAIQQSKDMGKKLISDACELISEAFNHSHTTKLINALFEKML